MRRRKILLIGTMTLSLLLPSARQTEGVLGVADTALVYDANNYFINILTQANTLKSTFNEAIQIANQAKELEYQLQSLWNEAQNLKKNPLQLLGQIQGMWNAYNNIMGNAEGLAYNLAQTSARFDSAYPALATGSIADVAAGATRMLASIRGATKTALSVQSIYERLCQQLTANQQALTAAQASEGQLQIAQAQAQIAAMTNEQLATLAQIEAANGRVQTEWIAMQAKERVDGAAVNSRFMEGYGSQGFKGIGQAQGVSLR